MEYFPWSQLPADIRRLILSEPEVYRQMAPISRENYRLSQAPIVLRSVCLIPISRTEILTYLPQFTSLSNTHFIHFIGPTIDEPLVYRTAVIYLRARALEVTLSVYDPEQQSFDSDGELFDTLSFGEMIDYLKYRNYRLSDPLFEYYIYLQRQPCNRVIPGYAVNQVRANIENRVNSVLTFIKRHPVPGIWEVLFDYLSDITGYLQLDLIKSNTNQILDGDLDINKIPNAEELLMADIDLIQRILEERLPQRLNEINK